MRSTSDCSLNRFSRILGGSNGSLERRVTSPRLSCLTIETPTPSEYSGVLLISGYQTLRAETSMVMQVNCMSGRSALGSVRMKMLPAAPLEMNLPLPVKNQRSTEMAARSKRSMSLNLPSFAVQPM